MKKLDFLEIGTSDFDTLIQKADDTTVGISVEPLAVYLDKLPNKKNCIKINCAVSNYDGFMNIYYVDPKKIDELKLPWWVKGCNSVGDYHPSVVTHLKSLGLNHEEIITIEKVKVLTMESLFNNNNIGQVKFLKIDTEGHDCVILNSYLDFCHDKPHLLANTIIFESNILSNSKDVDDIIDRFKDFGYRVLLKAHDTMVTRILFDDEIFQTYLLGYPPNFNPLKLPYENNLDEAKKWCIENKCGGVTYQYGRYEVRVGKIPIPTNDVNIKSWVNS